MTLTATTRFPLKTAIVALAITALTATATLTPNADGSWTLSGANTQARLQLELHDGENGKTLQPDALPAAANHGFSQSAGTLQWRCQATPAGRSHLLQFNLNNTGTQERRLEARLLLRLPLTAVQNFSLGYDPQPLAELPQERNGLKAREEKHVGASITPFPVAAAFSAGQAYFVGGRQVDPVSYHASRARLDGDIVELTFAIRFVVAPRGHASLRFTAGSNACAYGPFASIVQNYYDSFPEDWKVDQENPYIWGAHANYRNWWWTPNPELSRRLRMTMEWCYSPFKRAGEHLAQPEHWDYKPLNGQFRSVQFGGDTVDFAVISQPDFRRRRQDLFRRYGREFGWMFYNIAGTWTEIQLAQSLYPDAINADKEVMHIINGWQTHHDREIRTFPYGTSLEKPFQNDLKTLADELDLPGFAIDCAYAGAYYRGPAIQRDLPGRAWDEQGVFIDQSVSTNAQVDFMHSLRPDQPLTVFVNGYLKGDYVMVESPFVDAGKFRRWMPYLRYLIGPRPGSTHGHGYKFYDLMPDWHTRTTEEFMALAARLCTYEIFNQYQYGIFSQSYLTAFGNPQLPYNLPETIELVRAGYRPYLPFTCENEGKLLYAGRFGDGPNTFWFFGNPYQGESWQKKIKFDGRELVPGRQAAGVMVRKMRDRAETTNHFKDTVNTLDITLDAWVPYLLETVCQLEHAGSFRASASAEKNIHRQVYTVVFATDTPFQTPIELRSQRDFSLSQVVLDGATLPASPANGGHLLTAPVTIRDGSRLTITYASTLFHVPADAITSFPYAANGRKVDCAILIPPDAAPELQRAAQRFIDYFTFCKDKYIIDGASTMPSIITTPQEERATLALALAADQPEGIRVEGRTMRVTAPNPQRLNHLIKELMFVMDRRFPYEFPYQSVMGCQTDMMNHFKIWGKVRPMQRYFETLQP